MEDIEDVKNSRTRPKSSFKQKAESQLNLMANRLRHFREYVGKSQQEMAEAIETPQNFIHRVEKDCRVSLSGFIGYLEFLENNHNLNREWIFLVENKAIPMFQTTIDRRKRALTDRQQRVQAELERFISTINALMGSSVVSPANGPEKGATETTELAEDLAGISSQKTIQILEPADEQIVRKVNKLGVDTDGTVRKPKAGRPPLKK